MSDYRHTKHFTVDEANKLIPRLSALLVRLQDALRLLEGQREAAIHALQLARGNGKSHTLPEIDGLSMLREIVGEIESYGCVVKGFDEPLLDFPSLRDGDEVYLCWKLGEPEIVAWHELDTGFAGRRSL
jgi:hypothetical protein